MCRALTAISEAAIRILLTLILLALSATAFAQDEPAAADSANTNDTGSTDADDPADPDTEPADTGWLGRSHLMGDESLRSGPVNAAGFARVDGSYVADGGIDQRESIRALFSATVSFDLGVLWGIDGLSAHVEFQGNAGRAGSQDVGDIQGYDNLDAADFLDLYGLYAEQVFLDGLLMLRAGKHDTNNTFAAIGVAGLFLNSSAGYSPTAFTLPSYPDPSIGGEGEVRIGDLLTAKAGVYDGTGPTLDTFFDEIFVIGQADLTIGPLQLMAGGWFSSGAFGTFGGATVDGTQGAFAAFALMLIDEGDSTKGLTIFGQAGLADSRVAAIDLHGAGGIVWAGFIDGRDDDSLGVYVSWVHLVADAGFSEDHELALELTYRWQLFGWLAIQPDVQYIINPGGNAALDDALIVTLRIEAAL